MDTEVNPFESPGSEIAVVSVSEPPGNDPSEIRRTPMGTFLIGVWFLEGGLKVWLLASILYSGFDILQAVVELYRESSAGLYFLVAWLLIIETVGPWIGIYYLTGKRSRTIPTENAFWQIFKVTGGFALVATLLVMLYGQLMIWLTP